MFKDRWTRLLEKTLVFCGEKKNWTTNTHLWRLFFFSHDVLSNFLSNEPSFLISVNKWNQNLWTIFSLSKTQITFKMEREQQKKMVKRRSNAIKRTFPSSLLLTVLTREFAHVSSSHAKLERKRTAEARFLRRSSTHSVVQKITTTSISLPLSLSFSFTHSLTRLMYKKDGKIKRSLVIILLFHIVSGQLTTN